MPLKIKLYLKKMVMYVWGERYLKVPGLRDKPVVYELLGILSEAQEELSVSLQLTVSTVSWICNKYNHPFNILIFHG